MRRFTLYAVALTLGFAGAGCANNSGATGSGSGTPAVGGTVTLANTTGSTWTCGFHPYNPVTNQVAIGLIYEPLTFVNSLKSGATTDWLATHYAWSPDNKTLTFDIRQNVHFSDGTLMTPADVVFTYKLLKQYTALDLNGIWTVLSDVTAQGNQVVMSFQNPAVTYFYYIADQVGIVPQHIWSQLAHPDSDPVTKPVGTGPFLMNRCTPQNIEYVRNPSYWQPGKPLLQKVEYPAYTDNPPANAALIAGQAQWGSQYIANIQNAFLKNPNHHQWSPPVANVSLFLNNAQPPFNNPKLRQALAYAIDRDRIARIGETGQEPAESQSGVVTPTYTSWLNKDLAAQPQYSYGYQPDKALNMLQDLGYSKGNDGLLRDASGRQLTFRIINNGGFGDWVSDVKVLQSEFADLGIIVNVDELDGTTYQNDLNLGQFEAAWASESGGPAPQYEFRQELCSCTSAAIGQSAGTNYERYNTDPITGHAKDPMVDQLFNDYAATTDSAKQHDIVNRLQEIMLKDVPIIPVLGSVDWFQYDSTHVGGWVNPDDPSAQPAVFNFPDDEVTLLHLYAR